MAASADSKELEQLLVAFDNYVKRATGRKSYLKGRLDAIFEPLQKSGELLAKNVKNIKFNEFEKSLKGFTKDFNKLFKTVEQNLRKSFDTLNKNLFPKINFKKLEGIYKKLESGFNALKPSASAINNGNKRTKNINKILVKKLDAINTNLINIIININKNINKILVEKLDAINTNLINIRKDFDKNDSNGKNVGSGSKGTAHDDESFGMMIGALGGGMGGGIWSLIKGLGGIAGVGLATFGAIPFLLKGFDVAIGALRHFDKDAGKNKFIANLLFRISNVIKNIPEFFDFVKTFFNGGEEAVKLGGLLKPSLFGNLKNFGKMIFKGGGLKILGRIPFLGSLLSIGFAVQRFKKGDWVGGILDSLSAIANLFPGVGSVISLVLDGISMLRDAALGGSDNASKMTLKEQGSKMWDYVKEQLWPNIKSFFVDTVWGGIKDGFKSIMDWLGETEFGKSIKKWYDETLKPKIQPFIDNWGEIKKKIEEYWQNIQNFFGGIATMVSTAYDMGKEAFDDIWNQGEKLFNWIGENIITPIKNFFKPITDKLSEWGSKIADWATDLAKTVWDKLKEAFGGIAKKAADGISNGLGKAWDWISSPFKEITEVGRMTREAKEMEQKMMDKEKKRLEKLEKNKNANTNNLKNMKEEVEKGNTSMIPSINVGKENKETTKQFAEMNKNIESLQKAIVMSGVMNAEVTAKVGIAGINAGNKPAPVTQIFGGGAPDIDRLRLSGNRMINMPVGIA